MAWITVVSGLPRSGTSMMMQMIDAGGIKALTDQVRTADTDNPRGYFELEAVKKTRTDSSWLTGAMGRCVKLVHLLLMDLPAGHEYRVVFMRREMSEVIASQEKMLRRLGRGGGKLSGEQLARVYQQQLDKVDAWLAGQPHFTVLRVEYARVIGDRVRAVEEVNAFLGGGLDTQAMAHAVDPGLYRNRTG